MSLLDELIAAVQTKRPGTEQWDVVDSIAIEAVQNPNIITWALCAGIENIDARLRELATLLLCISNRALEELVPLMACMVERDPNIRVRKYLALTLWTRIDPAGQTDHLRQMVDAALVDPEISSPVKRHFLWLCPEMRPEKVFA